MWLLSIIHYFLIQTAVADQINLKVFANVGSEIVFEEELLSFLPQNSSFLSGAQSKEVLQKSFSMLIMNKILKSEAKKLKLSDGIPRERVFYAIDSILSKSWSIYKNKDDMRSYSLEASYQYLKNNFKNEPINRNSVFFIDWIGYQYQSEIKIPSCWISFQKLPATLDDFKMLLEKKLNSGLSDVIAFLEDGTQMTFNYQTLKSQYVWSYFLNEKFGKLDDRLDIVSSEELEKVYRSTYHYAEVDDFSFSGSQRAFALSYFMDLIDRAEQESMNWIQKNVKNESYHQLSGKVFELRKIKINKILTEISNKFKNSKTTIKKERILLKEETVLSFNVDQRKAELLRQIFHPFFNLRILPYMSFTDSDGVFHIWSLSKVVSAEHAEHAAYSVMEDLKRRVKAKRQGVFMFELAKDLYQKNPVYLKTSECWNSQWPCLSIHPETLAESLIPVRYSQEPGELTPRISNVSLEYLPQALSLVHSEELN